MFLVFQANRLGLFVCLFSVLFVSFLLDCVVAAAANSVYLFYSRQEEGGRRRAASLGQRGQESNRNESRRHFRHVCKRVRIFIFFSLPFAW